MKKNTKGLLFNIALSATFLLFFYHSVLFAPNSHLFTTWGDGIKNYYTYAYYIDNNTDTWNHEGLNYPYGESMFYTDCHPAIAFSVKQISKVFPSISNYSIGIINFLMIFSLLITSVLSYYIFRHFKIPGWLAAISAFGIMVLSPQIARITGHLALSYTPFIPLTLLLLLEFEESKKNIWSILQALNIFFWLTIHAYLGAIAAAFLVAYYTVKYLRDFKSLKTDKAFYYHFLLQVALPMLIFTLIVKITDIHTGRTNNPWGFFATRANFASVFLPHDKPLNMVYKWLGATPKMRWEGWAYIGIISTLTCAYFIFTLVKSAVKQKKLIFSQPYFNHVQMQNLLLAGIIVLLFAMAFPFKLGLQFLLDWFGFIKQFRASGRFAWVFFYIVNFMVVVYLYHIYQDSKYKKLVLSILILLPICNTIEGLNQHKVFSKKISQTKNLFKTNQLPEYFQKAVYAVNPNNYQAILSLPFYYIGGENFGMQGNDDAYFATELSSYHTGLPILGSHLTRNGIQEAKNICQVISPNWYKKSVVADLPSKKDILIVKSGNTRNEYENEILKKAAKIFSSKKMAYYRLPYDSLFAYHPEQKIQQFVADTANMYAIDDFFTSANDTFIYNGFENLKSTIAYRGKGAKTMHRKTNDLFYTFNGNDFTQSETDYIISFWVYNCGKNYGQDVLNFNFVVESKSADGKVSWDFIYRPSQSTIIKGCWSMVEMPVKIKKGYTYNILKRRSKQPKAAIVVDDLLIYKKGSAIYKILNQDSTNITHLFYNNHDIEMP